MKKKPCFSKAEIKKGPWTSQEDKILKDYVRIHGEGKWRNLAQKTGLKRCGKSCRLRWLNYLRPDIKLGNISEDEEDLIIRLHRLLGNRWTLIAGRLPGRSGNEIKNYWKTTLSKKLLAQNNEHQLDTKLEDKPELTATSTTTSPPAIRLNDPGLETKSSITACTPLEQQNDDQIQHHNKETFFLEYNASFSSLLLKENDDLMSFWMDSDEIGDRDCDAMNKNIRHKKHDDSEEVGALGHYGFSSDNFSKEP